MEKNDTNTYVGFGVTTELTNEGPKTTYTIANKKYPAEKLKAILDSIEPSIQEIEKKINTIEEKYRKEIEELVTVYKQTPNPVDKIKLAQHIAEIGANISTIVVHAIDIKNKIGL